MIVSFIAQIFLKLVVVLQVLNNGLVHWLRRPLIVLIGFILFLNIGSRSPNCVECQNVMGNVI